MSFTRSDKIKAKRDVAYLFETFTHEYIEPVFRGKNKRRKLRFLKSGVNYILETFETVRYEEQVRMMKVICGACRGNVDAIYHGKRYIHVNGLGVCKAWKIRNFMSRRMSVESRKLMRRLANSNISGYNIQGLTSRLKKGKII